MTTVRIRTKDGLGFRGFELSCAHQDTARLSPKRAAAIHPSRKRVAQRDCFQSATDFSERVCCIERAQKQSAAVELALPAAARAKER